MKVAKPLLILLMLAASPGLLLGAEGALQIDPPSPKLVGAEARQQLLITAFPQGRATDVTEQVTFKSADPTIASVSNSGVIFPQSNGQTQITASLGDETASVQVSVSDAKVLRPLHFRHDILPLLSKAGCNSGACHGKQGGQNGFELSVFGHDVAADYQALVSEARGRRVFPGDPSRSLLLTKAANLVPHGGGRRLAEGTTEFNRLLRWIAAGMPKGADDTPEVVSIELFPKSRIMTERSQQKLLVTATFSDGTTRDVTHEALFTSNDETLAQVDPDGRISTTMLAGEAAIVARYHGQVASSRITVPINKDETLKGELAAWDRSHFVDRLVADKWEELNLLPSAAADDATFHRRAYLDLIGKLPTPNEVRDFLSNTDPQKKTKLIDQLLQRPEYADYWALMWSDLLRVNRDDLGAKGAYHYHKWLRQSLANNQPYDEFLYDLLTAQGSTEQNGAVNFYKAFPQPNDLTIAVSQVFLGVRLECARCHHHPYEKWAEEDFYGLAAFFPRVKSKPGDGAELIYYMTDKGDVKHPRTQEVVPPHVLLGEPVDQEAIADPREELAAWATSPQNPFVARALVNRIWAQLMGRGVIEPIDDLRETNPPTNEPLLAALVDDFIAHDYDVKHLIRTIATSKVYGLSSIPNETNSRDTQNYSRSYRKRLGAEVLLDAVCDVTGEIEILEGMPPGTRAVQLWDHRLPSAFLDTFGRPQRKTVCECERVSDATLGQVLHLMNAPLVNDKITSPTGRAAELAAGEQSADEIITELYLSALGRNPSAEELSVSQVAFAAEGATRRSATEDVMWALLNSAEFVLNH